MYEKFYGFSERPFSLLPDPDFLFLGEKHRAALDTLELAIFNQSGFCVVSGEVGAGKTTLIRELLNRLSDDIQVGLVSNTHPSFGELMQWVMTAYGLPGGTDDRLELHRRFVDFVIQRYAEGKRTLLIIDEAQNLSMDALEELRMLSNINSEKDLVLQIIMTGQSELRDKLRKPELAQFAQRISVDYFLSGLDCDETCLYIQHRVVHAGGAADLFMMEACQHIYAFSQGIPRVINRLCDLSLVYGYAKHYEQIDAGLVEAVAREQHLGEAMETARQRAAVATENNVALKTEDDRPELRQPSEPESVVEPEPVSEIESVAEPEPVIEPEIVAETESVVEPELMPDNHEPPPELSVKPSADDSVATSAKTSGKAVSSDLHALVVNAEQSRNTRSERSALWLFVVVAVMVGAAAWMSRNEWMPAAGNLAALGEQKKEVSAQADETRRLQDEARLAEQARQAQVKREKAQREEAARLAEQRAAEKARQAQVKREKAQREKATRLAKQRAAEKAKQAQVKREKAQREKAARLAKQRAAEKAKQAQVKREKAQREKAARLAKQRAAEKAKQAQVRREQAKAKPVIVPATVSRPPVRSKDSVFPAAWANTPEWSEEDDDELLIEEPVVEAAVSPPAEATTATASVSEEENPDSVVEPGGFASNPCNGPTARFLSTCR